MAYPNEWPLLALTLALTLGAVGAGALAGRRHRMRDPEEAAGFVSSLAAPAMGLLALMVGFTFAMALTRFDARREAILEEANTIGTAALRGRMLAAPYARQVAPLFKEYAQLRVVGQGFRLGSPVSQRLAHRTAEIQQMLWEDAMAAAKADPHVVPTGLFIMALNGMIDQDERRVTAGRNAVPFAVFVMLAGVAAVALAFLGYGAEQAAGHHRLAMVIVAVMIAGVLMLVFDLDNPRTGSIRVSQQPLLDLIERMR